MALTMTRTRTQTTLTKLATMVANIHGELEFVQELLVAGDSLAAQTAVENFAVLTPAQKLALLKKQAELEGKREALYLAIKQFNPHLDPTALGAARDWAKAYGRVSTPRGLIRRYISALS